MIHDHSDEKLFHLFNDQISYVCGILKNGHLGHFYFGKRLTGPLKQSFFRGDQNRGLTPYVEKGDFNFSLNLERLECPVFGTSDFREPALDLTLPTGSSLIDFKYHAHFVTQGKPPLTGMPSTRVQSPSESTTLSVHLIDSVAEAELILHYTLFERHNVIARRAELINRGEHPLRINRFMSLSLDLMDRDWEWMQFSGDWIRERKPYTRPLTPGIQSVGSRRGASSAQHNPFVILKRPHTTEDEGDAIGLSLIYSGNFTTVAEVDSNNQTRFMTGIHPEGFSWTLMPQDTFSTPEALLSYSQKGLGQLSRQFHDVFRKQLMPSKWLVDPRPILINSWESTYFDFTEDKLLILAKEAAKVGIELFVLDDGWFGKRSDDTCGLGDWHANTTKLPSGISGLAEKIEGLGLKFGLWIEPEMINAGTGLFALHPDWVISDPSRPPCQARNQYVLDFSRPEVVEEIFIQLTHVLDTASIHSLKWDMNRNMTDHFSRGLPPDRQGELSHRYILGVYSLYEKLTKRYPDLLIESCSAGGGRFDPGMLSFAPQTWTSDNTDAISRLHIQYGTSFAYPLCTMGSHVSASPNHQVLRHTSLKTRGDVAFFGTFGYELDLTLLSLEEMTLIKAQIAFFKTHRDLIHSGDFYRLLSPFESHNETAWMVVSKDGSTALLAWYQILAEPNQGLFTLKLKGLDPHALYAVSGSADVSSGSLLMEWGLLLRPSFNGIHLSGDPVGDFQSRIWVLTKVE